MVSRVVTIQNQRGLHARASAKFVKVAGAYDAEVMVRKNETEVSGISIMGLMMLAASPGSQIELRATGPAAEDVVNALTALVVSKFDED